MNHTAFLFPGQGAQSVGMASGLCQAVPAAKELFDCAAGVLGYDLLDLCTNGPAEKLNSTVHSQPALFVASLAALEQLKNEQPDLVAGCPAAAGLSLGEYTALVFAGVMDFEAGLRVVQERGRAMQDAADACPSGMVSVLGMEVDKIEALCESSREGQVLQVANLLCPGNIVISGDLAACERLASKAEEAGAMRAIPLAVAGAFHTPIMESAVARLSAVLDSVDLQSPRIPVISNVDAKPHEDVEEIRRLLVEQVVRPVLWEDSMRRLLDEHSIEAFCEIGPGRVLRSLLRRIARKVPCENITV